MGSNLGVETRTDQDTGTRSLRRRHPESEKWIILNSVVMNIPRFTSYVQSTVNSNNSLPAETRPKRDDPTSARPSGTLGVYWGPLPPSPPSPPTDSGSGEARALSVLHRVRLTPVGRGSGTVVGGRPKGRQVPRTPRRWQDRVPSSSPASRNTGTRQGIKYRPS